MNEPRTADKHSDNPLVRYFRALGPGLVTGASDDDPSGVTTYAVAGATFGTAMLWTALVTLPLMAAIQLTCARIGLVSGRGLAGAMRQHYPRGFLGAGLRRRRDRGHRVYDVRDVRRLAQVAHRRALRLHPLRHSRASELAGGAARHAAAAPAVGRAHPADAGGNPRHDDLAVPLLLAGLAGGRGGACAGAW